MADVPNIEVERAEGPGPANSKDRNSNFMITLSTNYRPGDDAEAKALVDRLGDATDRIFRSPDSLERIIKFNIPTHHFDDRYIQDINVTHGPEVGKNRKGGRVHNHIILKIKHRSNITIKNSVEEIRREYARHGIDVHYVKIDFLRDATEAARRYAAKDQAPRAT